MTERQAQLIHVESKKHIAMAAVSREPVIRDNHLEVAEALASVLPPEKGGTDGDAQAGDEVQLCPRSVHR